MAQNQHIGITGKLEGQRQFALVEQLLGPLVYSNLFISCCAFSLTIETYKLASLNSAFPMAAFVFLATLFTYNLSSVYSFIRYPRQQKYKRSSEWWQRHKKSLACIGVLSLAAAAGVYLYFDLKVSLWIMLHLALISVGYTVPILYKSRQVRPLRSVPLLKVFLIAYVWAVATVVLPLMEAGVSMAAAETILLFVRRFLFILSLALLFDIRDYLYDKATKTLTIPGLIGVRNTKLLSLGLLALYAWLAVSAETGGAQWALVASAAGAGLVVAFSDKKRPRVYYALLADGAMLLHAGLVYLAFS